MKKEVVVLTPFLSSIMKLDKNRTNNMIIFMLDPFQKVGLGH